MEVSSSNDALQKEPSEGITEFEVHRESDPSKRLNRYLLDSLTRVQHSSLSLLLEFNDRKELIIVTSRQIINSSFITANKLVQY